MEAKTTIGFYGTTPNYAFQFAVVARWDHVADRMIERYKGIGQRLVIYLVSHWREIDGKTLARWGEVARAVRKAK